MLLLNENKIDEMILILQHMQKYVPTVEREEKISIPSLEKVVLKSNTVQHPILFGGDQLTVARTRGAQIAMSNSNDSVKRFQGMVTQRAGHAITSRINFVRRSHYYPVIDT